MFDQLTPRQQREREYYQEYAARNPPKVTFDPVEGKERRPWDSYWFMYEQVTNQRRPGSTQQILDFGCGSGLSSVRYAKVGYDVSSFDISIQNIELARKLAIECDLQHKVHFSIQQAEKLDYPDESFDVVAGMDILHHVEIPLAIEEIRRTLRPRGVAIFREHIEVPVLDAVRNTWLVKKLVPKTKSFDRHITEDERKLNETDLALIHGVFPELQVHRFGLLARANTFFEKPNLEWLDYQLFKLHPPLKQLGGGMVMIMKKEQC